MSWCHTTAVRISWRTDWQKKSPVPSIIESKDELHASWLGADEKRPTAPIPKQTKRTKWKRIDIDGFPYAPQEEEGVVALFAILCSRGLIKWQILDLKGGRGIDAICYDIDTHREIRVELKHTLSRGSWNHPIEDIDYVVCWLNRWQDFPKPVIELSSLVRSL